MREGKLASYIGYAVGEIALIVAGILIALQINDWAEERGDRRFERKTLGQIAQNLQADHDRLDAILGNRRKAVQSIDNILAISDSANPDPDFRYWLADVFHFDRFHSITNAYDVLKAHGLDIVRNDELRLELGVYYDNWARQIIAENKDIEDAFVKHWIPIIISDVDRFDWEGVVEPYDTKELLGDKVFINTLKLQQSNHAGAATNLEEMIVVNERLQDLITRELLN